MGQQALNLIFLFSALGLMAAQDEYIKWPADGVANAGAWWLLGDNWETTVIFCVVYSQFLTSGMLFTLGSHWRKAVFYNWPLTLFYLLAFAFTSFLLLADSNSVSEVFHMATQDFGTASSPSPVWSGVGKVSKAMPSAFRFKIWALILTSIVCTFIWEKFVVLGCVRDLAKRKYGGTKGVQLRL